MRAEAPRVGALYAYACVSRRATGTTTLGLFSDFTIHCVGERRPTAAPVAARSRSGCTPPAGQSLSAAVACSVR